MKILFVLEYYPPHIGGVERLFSTLAESLAIEGHQVTVLTTRFSPRLTMSERRNGVHIRRIDVGSRFAFTFSAAPLAYRLAKRHDLVHTTSYNAAVPAFIAAKLSRKPVLITFHEVWGKIWFKLPFLDWVSRCLFYTYEQMILRLPLDYWVAVSDHTKHALARHGIAPERMARIYNGMSYRTDKLPAVVQGPVFSYFGRLGVSKGIEVFLQAAAALRADGREFSLQLIIPKEPRFLRKKILGLIHSLGLSDILTIRHHLSESELAIRLLESLCVVVPSHTEGFGFSALEACALGVPVISSGKGALPEVVSGKFQHLDQLNARSLKNAMEKALRGQWDEQPEKRFELNETVAAYKQVYANLSGAARLAAQA